MLWRNHDRVQACILTMLVKSLLQRNDESQITVVALPVFLKSDGTHERVEMVEEEYMD